MLITQFPDGGVTIQLEPNEVTPVTMLLRDAAVSHWQVAELPMNLSADYREGHTKLAKMAEKMAEEIKGPLLPRFKTQPC